MISQFIKVDDPTWNQMKPAGRSSLLEIAAQCEPRLLQFDPLIFTHAYLLLGKNPTRSGYDLSYYLATVNGFFDRNNGLRQLRLAGTVADIRKRLSEDLAVAISSVFMNTCFGVDWRSIAQIPTNILTRKRPDFEGFSGEKRHVWESKGVSAPGGAEKALSAAIEQVKEYPEPSLSKLAIVSYFSHDPRLFESSTFVVDPEMPDIVPPDKETAQLLHVENVLYFAGLPKTASVYMKTLAKYLKAQGEGGESAYLYRRVPALPDRPLRFALRDEMGRLQERQVEGRQYSGRRIAGSVDGRKVTFWLGVQSDLLNVASSIAELAAFLDEGTATALHGDEISTLSDRTVLIRESDTQ